MALFDLFGIGSSSDYLSGFMSDEERRRLQERAGQNALLQAGLGMLANSGYSRTPVSLGQILGAGGQAGLQAYQGTLQQGTQDLVMRQKLEEMKREKDMREARQRVLPELLGMPSGYRGTTTQTIPGQEYATPTGDVSSPFTAQFQTQRMPDTQVQTPTFNEAEYMKDLAMSGYGEKMLEATLAREKKSPFGQIDPSKFTPESLDKFSRTGNWKDLDSIEKPRESWSDPYVLDGQLVQKSNVTGQIRQAVTKPAETKITVGGQEKEEQKAVGKAFGEQYNQIQSAGFLANKTIDKVNRLNQLLEGVSTGKLTPIGTDVASTAASLGFKVNKNLGNLQAAEALTNEMALQLRNPSGGAGMPGALSDSDRNFLRAMVPGIEKTPEGRRLVSESMVKLAKRDQEVAKLARDYRKRNGQLDEGFYDELAKYSEQNPLFTDMSAAPQPGGAGWSIQRVR